MPSIHLGTAVATAGESIATTSNDGFTTDPIDRTGRGSYRCSVCQEGSGVCSNEATITFQ